MNHCLRGLRGGGFLLLLLFSLTLWSAPPHLSHINRLSKSCRQLLEAQPSSQSIYTSPNGRATWQKLKSIERRLPFSVNDHLKRREREKWTLRQLIDHLFEQRQLQVEELSELAKSLPINHPLRNSLLDTARKLEITNGEQNNLSFLQQRYGHHSIKILRRPRPVFKDKTKTFLRWLNGFHGSHGTLAELKAAIFAPAFVAQGVRVYDLVPQVVAQKIRHKYPDEADSLLSMDIDVVYGHGTEWAEVKNYRRKLGVEDLKDLIRRAHRLLFITREMKRYGLEIGLHYILLRGGVTKQARAVLESHGIVVHESLGELSIP